LLLYWVCWVDLILNFSQLFIEFNRVRVESWDCRHQFRKIPLKPIESRILIYIQKSKEWVSEWERKFQHQNRKLLFDIKNPFDFNLIQVKEEGMNEGISINIDLQFNLIQYNRFKSGLDYDDSTSFLHFYNMNVWFVTNIEKGFSRNFLKSNVLSILQKKTLNKTLTTWEHRPNVEVKKKLFNVYEWDSPQISIRIWQQKQKK
jgi:hypothetical protein